MGASRERDSHDLRAISVLDQFTPAKSVASLVALVRVRFSVTAPLRGIGLPIVFALLMRPASLQGQSQITVCLRAATVGSNRRLQGFYRFSPVALLQQRMPHP